MKLDKKNIAFVHTEIEKHKFHSHENPILTDDVAIITIIVSNKLSYGKNGCKYFIGYHNNERVKPLRIMLPKMNWYVKKFNETKYMSFW